MKDSLSRSLPFLLFIYFAVPWVPVFADVKLPAVFGDHMVLQRQKPIPVWGTADAGQAVTVSLNGQTARATADAQGNWRVDLPAMEAGGPYELAVTGGATVRFADVLVGEVWLCSGQSNMVWPVMSSHDGDLEVATSNYPRIRLMFVPNAMADAPAKDAKVGWIACGPQSVGYFSAVGYFFGRELHRALDVPVGLIANAWGGSPAEAWMSQASLQSEPALKPLLDRWANPSEAEKKLLPFFKPSVIYNGSLAPLMPYGIRGVIWYQGESNTGRAYQYRTMFPLLIQSWRKEWGVGEFPFYFVQIANLTPLATQPTESDWSELREAQLMTMLKVPNTGMAVSIDIGQANDIHPPNKQDVGRRLARWALAKDYGVKVAYSGPIYKSMEKQAGGKIVLTFDFAEGGLMTQDKKPLEGFAIAGADRQWRWAKAELVGPDKVAVFSEQVADPVAVRYGWALNPPVSLYNKAGLPASPFRTDDWPGITVNLH